MYKRRTKRAITAVLPKEWEEMQKHADKRDESVSTWMYRAIQQRLNLERGLAKR